MWTLLVASLNFFSNCNSIMQLKTSNSQDTIVLFKKDSLITAGIVPAVLPFHFSAGTKMWRNSRNKILLLLENPTVVKLPEGVYEVYITGQPPQINNLPSLQPSFVNVLDLYSITAPAAASWLEVDISKHIQKIFFQKKQSLVSAYISIRFGPIKLADGTYSIKAGELRFTGISIVQINN
jgi:hypothetical protein